MSVSHAPGSTKYSLSIVVSALNEAESLERALLLIRDSLLACSCFTFFEILLVNDGSTDATGEIGKRLSQRYADIAYLENEVNRGIGYSFKKGVAKARCDYVAWLAADDSYIKEELVSFFSSISLEGKTVPISYSDGEFARQARSLFRRVISKAYRFLIWAFFGLKGVRYVNGLAVYRTEFLQGKSIISNRFALYAELVLRASHAGYVFENVRLNSIERKTGRTKIFSTKNFCDAIRTFARLFWEFHCKR